MIETEATARILELETLLDQGGTEILGPIDDDGVSGVCLAFAAAATRYHPSHFAGLNAEIVQRATLAFARLRAQFQQQVAEARGQRRVRKTTHGRLHPDRPA